jgi:dihydropyrimidinase
MHYPLLYVCVLIAVAERRISLVLDTVIQGGLVIFPQGPCQADLGIGADGRFHAFSLPGELTGKQVVSAEGLVILPGGVDPHVHINMQFSAIQKTIDDFFTGTMPAALGGTTTLVEFAIPRSGETTLDALERRYREASGKAVVDYNFHACVVRERFAESLTELSQLQAHGISTVKLFSAYCDTIGLDLGQIQTVMEACSSANLLVLVHCETESLLQKGIADCVAAGNLSPYAHLLSRSPLAEADAVRSICDLAADADVPVYIVHVSSADGAAVVRERRLRGERVYAETCTHYLYLDDAVYKRPDSELWICSPPIRERSHQEALWKGLEDGIFDIVSTDHNCFNRSQKAARRDDFRLIPNGLPSVEFRTPLLLSAVHDGRLDWTRLARFTAEAPARIFGLWPRKGAIMIGSDADFLLIDPSTETDLSVGHMATDYSPFMGITVQGRILQTWLRGVCIARDGALQVEPGYGVRMTQKPTIPPRAS